MMRIAVYHPWVYLKSGLERSLLELVRRSRYEWTIFTHHYDREGTYPELQQQDVVQICPSVSVQRSYTQVMIASTRIMRTQLPLEQFDALVVSSEGVGDFITFRNHSKPVVSFCLTPLKVVHDPQARAHYLKTHRMAYPRYTVFSTVFRLIDALAWRHYVKIVAISDETKRRILRANLAVEDKIQVIYPGIDTNIMQPVWNYEPYFLLPGRIMWQKNIQLGIQAFKSFREQVREPRFRLIIAGMVDQKSGSYYQELRELADGDPDIRFVVNPPDQRLFSLYQSSYTVLFTARNEDWGIVPLEAMAFGKPVISVARGGPLESIIHGKTGYLLEDTPGDFADAMMSLAKSPELVQAMGRAANQHAQRYNWDSFVGAFDSLLESIF